MVDFYIFFVVCRIANGADCAICHTGNDAVEFVTEQFVADRKVLLGSGEKKLGDFLFLFGIHTKKIGDEGDFAAVIEKVGGGGETGGD